MQTRVAGGEHLTQRPGAVFQNPVPECQQSPWHIITPSCNQIEKQAESLKDGLTRDKSAWPEGAEASGMRGVAHTGRVILERQGYG